jgi:type IV pilus assembly protein PilB
MSEHRLGELLIRENLITLVQLKDADETRRKTGEKLGYTLTKLGFIGERDLTSFLSKQYGVPSINLNEFEIDAEVIKLVPREMAQQHQVIPVQRAGNALIVAMADPSNLHAIDDVKFLTGYNIEPVVASEEAIRNAIERYYAQKVEHRRADGSSSRRSRSRSPSRSRTRTSSISSVRVKKPRSCAW